MTSKYLCKLQKKTYTEETISSDNISWAYLSDLRQKSAPLSSLIELNSFPSPLII